MDEQQGQQQPEPVEIVHAAASPLEPWSGTSPSL